MATYRKRGVRTQAQIRKMGFPQTSKTFDTKLAAKQWALETEAAMDAGTWVTSLAHSDVLVKDMFRMWFEYVNPIKPFCESKVRSIGLLNRNFGERKVVDLTPKMIMNYGARRRETVGRATLQKELSYFGQAVEFGTTVFDYPLKGNPVREATKAMSQIGMTGGGRCLERRLEDGEFSALIVAAQESKNRQWMVPVIELAVYTAMRRGELARMRWQDLDFEAGTIFIRDRKHPTEKIGNDQTIPMFPPARKALQNARAYSKYGDLVIPVTAAKSITTAFAAIVKKAKIENLRFHDLRHEGVSRLFERGWSIPQVAAVSGHRDWAQLKRYTQLKAEKLLTEY